MKDFFDELEQEVSLSDSQAPSTQTQKPQEKPAANMHIQTPLRAHSKPKKPGKTQQRQISQKNGNQKTQKMPNRQGDINIEKNKAPDTRKKYGHKVLQFPESKFFLPTLREGYTRYIPIGGNNEIGAKNMGMVQYGEDILLIDCGVQFAEPEMLGVDYSVPDVSFLVPYIKNIKGFLITHAHLDHIGALKDILPVLDMPTLYGTKLTLGLIKKALEEHKLLPHANFVEIDAGKENVTNIGQFKVEFFSVNHSIPDCAGLYIETPGGCKIVHTGDFKIDHTPRLDKPADFERYEEIGKRGVTLYLGDSTGSTTKGFSMSEKEVGDTLEKIISEHTGGRLIIAAFSSWISRVQQLIDIAEKYDKYIFLSGRSMVENIAIAQKLGYLTMKPGTIKKLTVKNTESIPYNQQIVITTGSQGKNSQHFIEWLKESIMLSLFRQEIP